MIDPKRLDPKTKEAIGENRNLSGEELDRWIAGASPRDLLDAYLTWNGIIGWTSDILRAVASINEAAGIRTVEDR